MHAASQRVATRTRARAGDQSRIDFWSCSSRSFCSGSFHGWLSSTSQDFGLIVSFEARWLQFESATSRLIQALVMQLGSHFSFGFEFLAFRFMSQLSSFVRVPARKPKSCKSVQLPLTRSSFSSSCRNPIAQAHQDGKVQLEGCTFARKWVLVFHSKFAASQRNNNNQEKGRQAARGSWPICIQHGREAQALVSVKE